MKMLINIASGQYLTDENVRALRKHVLNRRIIRAISLNDYNGTIYIRGFFYDAEEYGSMLDKDGAEFVKEIADLCKLSGVGRVIIVPNLAMYPRVEFGAGCHGPAERCSPTTRRRSPSGRQSARTLGGAFRS